MGKKTISENELIKNDCKIDMRWENDNSRWIIKINHITDDISYSSVRVIMEGFENFSEAIEEAMKLFKRNIRNGIKDNQTVKATYLADDVWPEILTEKA